MIIWYPKGPIPSDKETKDALDKLVAQINKDIAEKHEKCTIRQMYAKIGGMGYSRILKPYEMLLGEFFIDPDEWGWDEKGFRRLYRTVTIREEL